MCSLRENPGGTEDENQKTADKEQRKEIWL